MLTTPRGITQSHTSFIGSACQGIHHAPFSNKHNNTHPTTHRRQRHVPGYTTHTHTKNILQRRKMLASTIQFSHTTPTTTNHHTNSDQQTVSPKQEQPPTHHTTTVMQPAGTMCCPRHPTVHQQFINVWNYRSVSPAHSTGIVPARCASTWIFHTTVAAPRSGTQPLTPTTVGKIKAP